jgi:serine/threonine-protein kinase RsbW
MKQQNELELQPSEFMGSNLTCSVEIVVASAIEAISPAVDQLMQSLKTSCCSPEQEVAVEMALREALANAIVHGNHEDLRKKVRVCCACDAKRGMLIVVKDQGEGFDPSKIPSPLAGRSILSEHGRGIYLINLLMDEVQFRKHGTEIRMRKNPHSTGRGASRTTQSEAESDCHTSKENAFG